MIRWPVLLLLISILSLQDFLAATNQPWLLTNSNSQIEREHDKPQLISPALIGRQTAASRIFNGRPPEVSLTNEAFTNNNNNNNNNQDWFECVEPTRSLFEQFVAQYNRSFESSEDKLERLNLFAISFKRIIMLNRIIQNDVQNMSNYLDSRQDLIKNYHFISPLTNKNQVSTWYSDITDCELGLIKYTLFDIFYLIDKNDLEGAYKKVLDNAEYLPLLNDDGFEQLANILLIRLYDRFRGDEKMIQLFQWPLYLKKLASFVYHLQQVKQPNFRTKLSLITYAYPAYFKDIKYNLPAINRTADNYKMHNEHEKFNNKWQRKFSSRQERNKRLSIFRQRQTHLELLNNLMDDQYANRWQNVTFQPEWLRAFQSDGTSAFKSSASVSEKLQAAPEVDFNGDPIQQTQGGNKLFRLTQFSDLSDAEFVAYLTNDFSLLDNNKESAQFIDSNFPIRPLDDQFRAQLALELEMRRTLVQPELADSTTNGQQQQQPRKTLVLARRVVDELIGDVGLPIGSVVVGEISQDEQVGMFTKIANLFQKPYMLAGKSLPAKLINRLFGQQSLSNQQQTALTDSDQLDERTKRFDEFKLNYGRFKAWFIKEGWTNRLSESQQIAMLRLSDLSWLEIKTILFRICCLTEDTLTELANSNATINYMGSIPSLCQPMDRDREDFYQPEVVAGGSSSSSSSSGASNNGSQDESELAALELYYYYSVHFNKHHADMDLFQRRFSIFKYNVEHLRRHSCTRGLSLYRSLKLKRLDTLSNIDTLDPRRSFTDDLNLDRFKYFEVPNLSGGGGGGGRRQSAANYEARYDFDQATAAGQESSDSGGFSRAGISYRREPFFSSLFNQRRSASSSSSSPQNNRPPYSYAEKLLQLQENPQLSSMKYKQNAVNRVYDYVMQRYRLCLRTIGAAEPANYRQQCKSDGPLGDQAANGPSSYLLAGEPAGNRNNLLMKQEQCAMYRLGLESWNEGLISQDLLSAQLIQAAKC